VSASEQDAGGIQNAEFRIRRKRTVLAVHFAFCVFNSTFWAGPVAARLRIRDCRRLLSVTVEPQQRQSLIQDCDAGVRHTQGAPRIRRREQSPDRLQMVVLRENEAVIGKRWQDATQDLTAPLGQITINEDSAYRRSRLRSLERLAEPSLVEFT
jgi:hypothetical protein